MLKRFGTTRAPTRSGSCEAVSLGSFSDRRDQKLMEMKWAIFLFHSYGYRLERRSIIRGCAGGHRKSRWTAGAIHRRNICGRCKLLGSFGGRFQATNIGEVVLIGTHGAQLIIASAGAIRRQGLGRPRRGTLNRKPRSMPGFHAVEVDIQTYGFMLSGCRSSRYRSRIGELFEAGKLTIDYCRNMRELACEWFACAFVLAGIIRAQPPCCP
jgi:hypothetical protein